ncbi:MAG: hypothetical protein L3J53_02715 [Proteobacteria bacterium]|nr:hypothetical protein [Pseudomonadota bacterium]
MKIANWEKLPDDFKFNYTQAQLAENWDAIHIGDKAEYPLNYEGDEDILTAQAEGWLQFHNGNFQKAAEIGLSLGADGAVILAKAVTAYCDYLCEDEDEVARLLQETMDICGQAAQAIPECHNTQFVYALIMGRYSQNISITKALAQGLGGKIKTALEATLALEPNYAEAHTAMALYHAEIIDKVGAMLGGLTYGAKKPIALQHFDKSMELAGEVAITAIEYANGLLLLGGQETQATELYQQAAQCRALDAMQNCDVSFAQDQLDDA